MPHPIPVRPVPPATPRRLPAVPLPGAEESLTSWINRIGLAYLLRRPDLLAALGLTSRGEMSVETANLDLSESSKQAVSAATALPVEMIEGMLLSRFMTTALPNLPRAPYTTRGALRPWSGGSWALRRQSNFCPKCLAKKDRWQLDWRLPWTFACLDHRIYLHAVCPRCRRAQTGVNWGRNSRICQRYRPVSATDAEPPQTHPHMSDGPVVCAGRLDEAETIPLHDFDAFKGQQRLLRWLYGPPEESALETEFASMTAIVAKILTPAMLYNAQPELQQAHYPQDASDTLPGQRQPKLSAKWADPLHMAGAAHVAQFLSATEDTPKRAIQWLVSSVDRYRPPLFGTSLVFGPFHHDTEHMREALRADLVYLPFQGPSYVNDLSPYTLRYPARRPPQPSSHAANPARAPETSDTLTAEGPGAAPPRRCR